MNDVTNFLTALGVDPETIVPVMILVFLLVVLYLIIAFTSGEIIKEIFKK